MPIFNSQPEGETYELQVGDSSYAGTISALSVGIVEVLMYSQPDDQGQMVEIRADSQAPKVQLSVSSIDDICRLKITPTAAMIQKGNGSYKEILTTEMGLTQDVIISGFGTLTFTDGLLTAVTPE